MIHLFVILVWHFGIYDIYWIMTLLIIRALYIFLKLTDDYSIYWNIFVIDKERSFCKVSQLCFAIDLYHILCWIMPIMSPSVNILKTLSFFWSRQSQSSFQPLHEDFENPKSVYLPESSSEPHLFPANAINL